jgi:hypothetical protein
VKTLQEELEIKKVEVMNESKEVEELLKIINAKKEIATKDNEEATIKKK